MAETLLYQGVGVNPANGLRVRLGHNIETLAAPATLTPQSAQLQALDPGGTGETVVLPAEEASQGLFFFIKNTGSGGGGDDLTVEDDTTVAVTIASLANNECTLVVCDGTSWTSLGVITFA